MFRMVTEMSAIYSDKRVEMVYDNLKWTDVVKYVSNVNSNYVAVITITRTQ